MQMEFRTIIKTGEDFTNEEIDKILEYINGAIKQSIEPLKKGE